ncbi:MAG: ATP-binding cassette domain-containing protein [Alphaproteobacteria bacterium]
MADTSSSSLSLNDITLTLGSEAGPVNILKGISLDLKPGETTSVVGPSGAGKSSMMMLAGGLERPTGGDILVAGQKLNDMSEDQLAVFRRRNIGIVFQNFHLVPTMTALENVAIPLEFAGDGDAFDKAEARLKAVGLDHRLTHYPGQLSGGEQQRVALARALVATPRLLLADEPTGNLDGKTGEAVIELMFEMANETGATLMLITHDHELANRCSRQIEIADGLIAGDSARLAQAAE